MYKKIPVKRPEQDISLWMVHVIFPGLKLLFPSSISIAQDHFNQDDLKKTSSILSVNSEDLIEGVDYH